MREGQQMPWAGQRQGGPQAEAAKMREGQQMPWAGQRQGGPQAEAAKMRDGQQSPGQVRDREDLRQKKLLRGEKDSRGLGRPGTGRTSGRSWKDERRTADALGS
jgi:hypothetical protein